MTHMPRGVSVAPSTRGELCRTTLATDSDEGGACLLPRPLSDYPSEHFLYLTKRLWLTDLFADDCGLKGLEDRIPLTDLGDEVRAHIASPIGDRIEESQRIDRGDLGLVAIGHPGKCGSRPTVWVIRALTDTGTSIAVDLELEVFPEA